MSRISKAPPKQRKRPYFENRETETGLGGWNADATISDRPKGDLSEVFNMRKMRPGELEVRTGYRQYSFQDDATIIEEIASYHTQSPLWKAEYRMDEVFVDVTFYSKSGTVYALIFNPATETSRTETICACGASLRVCAYQFQTYLIISVLSRDLTSGDALVFALSPNASDKATLVGQAWLKTSLGKQVTPAPSGFMFSATTTGKLLAFIPKRLDQNPTNTSIALDKYLKDTITGENRVVALDIKAPYFLSGSPASSNAGIPLWTKAKEDPSIEAVSSSGHLKSRGWWGRAVLKRKFTDARGQTHVVTEAPSADWYIEERKYVPPFIVDPSTNKFPSSIRIDTVVPPVGNTVTGTTVAVPDNASLNALRQKFLDMNNGRYIVGNDDSLYFLAASLSAAGPYPTFSIVYWEGNVFPGAGAGGAPPYKLDAGSWEISGTPNAVYTWADFGLDPTTDTTLYSIDFYRTAYSFPVESDNATRDPLWGTAYNYGYVGTLHAGDASFTDNIADTALLFDESPNDAEGYLEGEFAGEVMRPYQDHLVLGNVRTKSKVRTPWSGMQSLNFKLVSASGFDDTAIGNTAWWYRYVDRDGHESNVAPITLTYTPLTLGAGESYNIAFMFPRGYSDRIVSARLIRGIKTGQSWAYYEEATVALSTGAYVSTLGNTAFVATSPKSSNIDDTSPTVDDDPGYIIWSKVNDPWAWPQENNENEHDQNPITALDEVIGPLYVVSDKGIVMTRLNGYREPVHTSGTGVGCISRYACVKVDKVVFMMSASGLIYVEGSGVVPFPADIETEINIRLREIIHGKPSLHGVRERVSMCYLANRKELWITFPATYELDGALPARTFIIKFLGGKTYAYEFEISVPHHDGSLSSGEAKGLVIHLPHADGTMWSAFHDDGTPNDPNPDKRRPPSLYIQDNDDATKHWPGQWAFQYEEALGMPNVTKTINQVNFLAASISKFYQVTGLLRQDGQSNRQNGTLMGPAREIRNQPIGSPSQAQIDAYDIAVREYHLPISGTLRETTGTPPGIRYYGEPDQANQNKFKIQSLDVYYDPKSQHKGD